MNLYLKVCLSRSIDFESKYLELGQIYLRQSCKPILTNYQLKKHALMCKAHKAHNLKPIHHFCRCRVNFSTPQETYSMEFLLLSLHCCLCFQEPLIYQNLLILQCYFQLKIYLMLLYLCEELFYREYIRVLNIFTQTN